MSLYKVSSAHACVLGALHTASFDEPWIEHAFSELLKLPTTIGWCDEQGFILCSHVLDEMEIMTICTHPDYRRQGVAQNLLNTMIDYAKLSKVSKIFLEVRSDNIPAQKLYAKMGFIENGIRKGYYTTRQGPIDAVCMVHNMLK
jgi:ribosomal-protein-alanine N-acetyltransferase